VGYRAVARSVAQYALDQARAMVDFQAKDLGRWLEAQRTNAALLAASDKTQAIATASPCGAGIARHRNWICAARL